MNPQCTPAQPPEKMSKPHRSRSVISDRAAKDQPVLIPRLLTLALLLVALLSGCQAQDSTPLPPTQTSPPPTATLTPSPTIIWFPPTATFTPFPTSSPPAPTEELRTNLGDIVLEDNFSSTSPWTTTRTADGNALIGANELTISIPSQKVYLTSMRQEPVLGDFYLEITAGPTFCQGQDEYGLLLRYSSPGDFYRVGVSCDGQVRLDRLYRGQASSPQPWLLSGALPIGAPSRSRLAVWVRGRELRVFVNDEFQFQVSDPQHTQGQIGVFARSTGDHLLTVGFSNLVIRQINP